MGKITAVKKVDMTFDHKITLTSMSCIERPKYRHDVYQIWWKLEQSHRCSGKQSEVDLWSWGDLVLWPTKNPTGRNEYPHPKYYIHAKFDKANFDILWDLTADGWRDGHVTDSGHLKINVPRLDCETHTHTKTK